MTFEEERVHLIITKLCNNNCSFCFNKNEDMDRKYGSYDRKLSEIKKDIDMIALQTNYIVISGGEPTIKKEFFDIIKYIKEKGITKIKIMTNGRNFSSSDFCRKLERIKDIKLNFNVTILGSDKKIHDKISRREGSFYETVNGIKNLIKLGKRVTTHTPITQDNYHDIVNISKILINLGVEQQAYSLAFNSKIPEVNLVLKKLKEVKKICQIKNINLKVGGFPFCMVNNMAFFSCNDNFKLYDKNYYFRSERNDNVKNQSNLINAACNWCELKGFCSVNWIRPEKLVGCGYNPLTSPLIAKNIINSL